MFVDIEDTRMLWFNPQSFEVDHNYKLIGMLLGLAVYNNIILDIRFPTVSINLLGYFQWCILF